MGRSKKENEYGMKIYSIYLSEEAKEDTLKAYFWYEKQRKGLGKIFQESLDSKLKSIRELPGSSSYIFENIRSAKTKRFPYNIIYRIVESQIQVVAIFHSSRNPDEWKKRI